jgi:chitinase
MKLNFNSRLLVGVVASLLALSSCNKDKITDPVPTGLSDAAKSNISNLPVAANFKLVGYLPSYQGDVSAVQYTKLTHINYAFATPHTDGTVTFDYTADKNKFQSLVTAAHSNNVKVLISVGGGGNGGAFSTIVASSSLRTTFANNMVAFCDQYNCEGVDIDWEFPSAGTQANNFTTMMQTLTTALHADGKLCTAAVISTGATYVTTGLMSTLDWLNIMDYDDNNYQHSTYQSAVDCLNYWKGRGLAISKTVLGLPFYARDNTQDYATLNYSQILSMGGSPNADTFEGRYGYNGIPTVQQKTTLALSSAGGLMMWDLGGDVTGANSLVSAIYTVASGATTPLAGPPIGHVVSFKGFNGKFVSGENGTTTMDCTKATDGDTEHFTVLDAGNGYVYLRSKAKYVSSENGTQSMTDNRATPGAWETFAWAVNTDGTVTLRSVLANNAYVSSENGTKAMTCNRATASGWESFTVTIIQ